MVEIRDLARLPETRGLRPAEQDVVPSGWARVSYIRDLPDGRRFVNDSRGLLYLLDRNNQPSVYANVASAFPFAIYNRLESGFIGFTFHPEFARNGLFYTVHGERAAGNPATLELHLTRIHAEGCDPPQRHHRVACRQPGGEHVRGDAARAAARCACRQQPDPPDGCRRVQPDSQTRLSRLRSALHERQRPRIQQRWRTECEQPRPDPAPRFRHHGDPADRSAQSLGDGWHERAWRLHDPGDQQVRGRWRSRRRLAKSSRTAFGTPTGSRGISPMERCSPRTSG